MNTQHTRFSYHSLDALRLDAERMGLDIPISDDLSVLAEPVRVGEKTIPNRLCVLPMEGRDASAEGEPTELSLRRYTRFAHGGAGLLWAEADAVAAEGRSSPAQFFLNPRTLDSFSQLCTAIDCAARDAYPDNPRFQPYKVLQLTHSGRYSKPDPTGEAIIASENLFLDPYLPEHSRVISDEELRELIPAYVNAAVLAKRAGFDAVDVKTCHFYLMSELLGARTRPGAFGGSFENRRRLLFEILDRIQDKTGGLDVTLRISAFDAIPYPYGFGVSAQGTLEPDLSEPLELVQLLRARGVRLLAVSIGDPYYNPHVGRPYDGGFYTPTTHPLADTARIFRITRAIQQAVPDVAVVSTGMSWLREYAANVAAGMIRDGYCSIAGFGRQAFAYPDFARDILMNGGMQRTKCCTTCSNCTALMRSQRPTGCPIRDREVYGPLLRDMLAERGKIDGTRVADHV